MLIGLVPDLFTESNDTAKSTVEFAGISGSFPFSPNASSGGTLMSRRPPTFIPSMPTLIPRIMLPGPEMAPKVKPSGLAAKP